MRTWINGDHADHLWKVHMPLILKEIVEGYPSNNNPWIGPVKVIQDILIELTELAQEIDDPRLHLIMCRLAMYSVVEKSSPDYDPDIFDKLREQIKQMPSGQGEQK